jgi:phage terminase large subunit
VRDFVVRGAAADLMRDQGKEALIVGSAGTGKTVAALMKLHADASRVRGLQALIVRQTHASLTASTLVAFEQFVAKEELASGKVKWFGGSASKPAGYRYANGSMIMPGGMDNPGKVLSMSLDRVLIDEANQVSVVAYETLLTRLRGSADTYRQIVSACNPDHPKHWLKERADSPDNPLRMYTSRHEDNPYLCDRDGTWTEAGVDYLGFLDGLTGVRRMRYRDGLWVAAEGMVYDTWRDDVNVLSRSEMPNPDDCRIIWSIDWGYSNPAVWQEWLVDGDGRMYLNRELHQTQQLVEDFAKRIKELTGYRPDAIVADHDAEDRATFTRHIGMPTVAAKKDVSRGVQIVAARMRAAGDGRPRLFVCRDALMGRDLVADAQKRPRGFLGEVTGYVWAMERGADGIPREHPAKVHDHSMDAARYAAMYLDADLPARTHNPAAQRQTVPSTSSRWGRPVGR